MKVIDKTTGEKGEIIVTKNKTHVWVKFEKGVSPILVKKEDLIQIKGKKDT